MLKWFAVLFMFIDHLGYYLQPVIPDVLYLFMRLIGRLSYPIFAYGIVLGVMRTRSISAYFMRLILFAIASQVVIEIASFLVGGQAFMNVIFTLAFGLLIIVGIEFIIGSVYATEFFKRTSSDKRSMASLLNVDFNLRNYSTLRILLGVFLLIISVFMVTLLKPDYGLFGIAVILLFYILERKFKPYSNLQSLELRRRVFRLYFISLLVLNILNIFLNIFFNQSPSSFIGIFSTFAVLLFPFEPIRKERPKLWEKYFFYIFYPLHISILMIISAHIR